MKKYIHIVTAVMTVFMLLGSIGCSKKEEAAQDPTVSETMVETNLVKIETSMGTIAIELNPEKAPLSVENFKAYVREGFYNNTIVHRIENQGMYLIQAGGIQPNLTSKSPILPAIPCESNNGLKNRAGTIGYGRRAGPNTATSHFFINYRDNPGFDYDPGRGFTGYAVFGEVVEGNDVAMAIAGLERLSDGRPAKQVLIKSANIVMRRQDAIQEETNAEPGQESM